MYEVKIIGADSKLIGFRHQVMGDMSIKHLFDRWTHHGNPDDYHIRVIAGPIPAGQSIEGRRVHTDYTVRDHDIIIVAHIDATSLLSPGVTQHEFGGKWNDSTSHFEARWNSKSFRLARPFSSKEMNLCIEEAVELKKSLDQFVVQALGTCHGCRFSFEHHGQRCPICALD